MQSPSLVLGTPRPPPGPAVGSCPGQEGGGGLQRRRGRRKGTQAPAVCSAIPFGMNLLLSLRVKSPFVQSECLQWLGPPFITRRLMEYSSSRNCTPRHYSRSARVFETEQQVL